MATNKDRVALPPVQAQRTNLTCHFCIVGCGYHVFKWPENTEGGRAPNQNALGLDFRKQLPPLSIVMTPAMQNTITDKDGRRYNIMVVPDKACSVNRGLSSTRGGQLAKVMYSPDGGVAKERLRSPRVYLADQWMDTSWDDALALYAGLAKKILDRDGPSGLAFDCFDHGGAGGGFENTWGTGKLMFTALKTPLVRIHNRPAYNSECHATREMGIGELNNSYEDAELADVIMAIGCNSYETQTNYFLAHWMPNLQGQTLDKRKQRFPGESIEAARIIFVDPRRTTTVAIAEHIAGKQNVLHLDIEPGTDIALFDGLLTYVVDQGWHDKAFIAAYTNGFDDAVRTNRLSLDETSRITGVSVERLKQAADWAYKPKASGHRPRTMHAYEKGIIWGNDNYLIQSALVDVVLATHNVGRRGTGVVRMGGHQEGYTRPPYPGNTKIYVDQEIIHGKGMMYTAWGANPFQTTLNAEEHRAVILHRAGIVREAMSRERGASTAQLVDVAYDAVKNKGGLFFTNINLYPTKLAEAAHLMLPAAHPGEMNLTSMNGERRMRLSERFMDPPGSALPDCLIAAAIANTLKQMYEAEGKHDMAARFGGFDWKTEEDAFNDGFRQAGQAGVGPIDSQGGKTGNLVTYARLRAMGNNGVQLPAKSYEGGKLIGTEMLYTDGKFDTADGKAQFKPAKWTGLPKPVADQKAKYRFWINNGRVNEVWQTLYHDQYNEFVRERVPMAFLELNPDDAHSLDITSGDVVEVFNDYGSTYAMAYLEPSIKRGQTFMQFGHFNGIMGNVTTPWTDRNVVPYYKGTWANLRRVGDVQDFKETVSFKSRRIDVT
ncbi:MULTISPECIES: arsenate reductase (azurin) large subunit [Burkholderia]|uniref:Arsenite oxidase large subunit n=1 Tax=Burkholderia multivorans (strain ATCC 17616 / 249) TaxID=395019 RepID=A0A0H3KRE9_BURM1|nr:MULTISPECIES: arsenate reductase (azurin) large subunit [Burkholderia]ABX19344.1 arsenite oxidase, large subunit [Burkholderia multivorans ATCC 17616]AIO72107.1 arsenite oxidase, large subunit [Burkholderia multivorans]MBR7913759.1 arsenate reductase (azurin) large subunit [Burkholderia vietnamiensis]MBU9146355.1 arsenate reductase (azurin) large subunit [Burkholderia multivorans]MBU9540492.1 arsenate reductase (azurin) large subunit [Burkholderia multivorans]